MSFLHYLGEPKGSKSSNTGAIIGAVVGILVFLVLAILIGLYIIRKKRTRSSELNPFGKNWLLQVWPSLYLARNFSTSVFY